MQYKTMFCFIMQFEIKDVYIFQFSTTQLRNVLESEQMICFQIAEVLIDNGAKINMQDAVNFTPLHIACNFGNDKVCLRTQPV